MSRIGKQPITIPQGINVEVKQDIIKVKGAKGELKYTFPKALRYLSLTARSLLSGALIQNRTGRSTGLRGVLCLTW